MCVNVYYWLKAVVTAMMTVDGITREEADRRYYEDEKVVY